MHPILAENLDGWILAAMALFGGLGASVLALLALIPAWKGNRPLTLAMATPAFVVGVIVTIWLSYGFMTTNRGDADSDIGRDVLLLWAVMAGIPFVTSLMAAAVLWIRRIRRA